MIADMRLYDYFLYGDIDEYGQPTLSNQVQGQIKMNINIISQQIDLNSLYSGATYIGLTMDKNINDKYVILHEGKRLKVLYVNSKGRYKQIFMGVMA